MTKKEKLRETEALIAAITSEKKALLRLVDSRAQRRRVVKDAVKSIRTLKVRLAQEIRSLQRARGVSNSDSEILAEVDKWTARLKELAAQKSRLEHAVAIERLQKMFDEINSMEEEVAEEDIIS